MILIGISGKKQSGKDTVGNYFIDSFPQFSKFKRINFADALKVEVSRATGIDISVIEQRKSIFRPILQWWGTDFRRNLFDKNYWIKQWSKYFENYKAMGTGLIICTDVRFLNEAEEIKNQGGILIRIKGKVSSTDYHQSETDLDTFTDFDYFIRNYGTLDDLRKATEEIAKDIMALQNLLPH